LLRFFYLSVIILELSKKFQYEQPELKSHHHKSTSSSFSSSTLCSISKSSSEIQTLCEDEAYTIDRAIIDIVSNQATPLLNAIGIIVGDCVGFIT
jgi:hypothetical protein